MARYKRFTFLINAEEREVLDRLAAHLERRPSDAIRYVIRRAARELEATQLRPTQTTATTGDGDSTC